ncbi:polysaccharide biosynthesis protein [Pedobacter sp. SYSU D00535]|uniref:polysaccharide biosynthesis protein n=1 Tax=Pedobacter sp. SYSU D00535 TaxID=2810308 RepID=UPI001A96485F|nr:polysaccharide biosynthesis protein [Pedobacter sp. SYSU D00535]
MRTGAANIIKTSQDSRFREWLKLLTITGFAQGLVQAVGLVSGILIIRLLPTEEYALYTLANTMLGTMTVLADGGISTGVMSQGGKVWNDRKKLGAVLATGLELRRKFAIASFAIALPILVYLLRHHHASWLTTILIVVSLIPAFFAALSDSLLEIVPKLHQEIVPLQRNQVEVGIGRLFLSALLLFIFPWTFVAILAAGIPRIYGNIKLRKIARKFHEDSDSNSKVRQEILTVVKKSLPMCIYYVLSGQISLWVISFFGEVNTIAELGALSRLAAVFTLVSVMANTLIVPRFSRMEDNKNKLLKLFLAILLAVGLLSAFLLLITSLFPQEILWILGDEYKNLGFELVLNVLVSCIGLLAVIGSGLIQSRGWVLNSTYMVAMNIVTLAFGAIVFDLSTLTGVLYYNILAVSGHFIMVFLYGLYSILKSKQV